MRICPTFTRNALGADNIGLLFFMLDVSCPKLAISSWKIDHNFIKMKQIFKRLKRNFSSTLVIFFLVLHQHWKKNHLCISYISSYIIRIHCKYLQCKVRISLIVPFHCRHFQCKDNISAIFLILGKYLSWM